MAGIYTASSVIQTRSVMVHLGNVQISGFVRISEIHAKLTVNITYYDDASFKKMSPQSG